VRSMASQKDKSADLFAPTARPNPSLFTSREPVVSAPSRNLPAAQVCANAADGRAIATPQGGQKWLLRLRNRSNEPAQSTFHKIQVEPTEQPSAGESSGEAA